MPATEHVAPLLSILEALSWIAHSTGASILLRRRTTSTLGDLVLSLTSAACLQSATRIKELESLTTMLRSQLQASSTSAKDVLETAVQILAEGAALPAEQARSHVYTELSGSMLCCA